MLSVEEALELISSSLAPLGTETRVLGACLDATLAADIVSGQDSPPFDKSLMDGFAVRSADCASKGAKLEVVEQVVAGATPTRDVESLSLIHI